MSQAEHDTQLNRRRGGFARPRHGLEVLCDLGLLIWQLYPSGLRCGLGSYRCKGCCLLTLLLACSSSRGHKFNWGRGGDGERGGGRGLWGQLDASCPFPRGKV